MCASHFSDEGNCCKECAEKLEVQTNTKRAIEAYNVSDYVSAFAFAQKSDQNDAEIQYIIGYGFDNGYGCDKNQEAALKWYHKSAEQGNAEAQYALGKAQAILFDERRREKEEYEGMVWLRKAANQSHISAEYYIGYYLWWYYDTHDAPKEVQAEGVFWLNKAAEYGHVEAQRLLGYIYLSGDGAEKDYEAAVRWYRAAAEQGSLEAQYELGGCYERGCGVTADLTEAAHWYYYAAEQGYKDAEYKLGSCFYNGKGYSQNYAEAAKWFRKAAEHGNIDAQRKLGDCYFYGRGVPKDEAEAEKWYRKSGGGKDKNSAEVYLVMGDDVYRTIAEGKKNVVRMDFDDYWVERILSCPIATVKLMRCGTDEHMTFEIEWLGVINTEGHEIHAFDENGEMNEEGKAEEFVPDSISIHIGNRIV